MKKIVGCLVSLLMVFTLVGCVSKDDGKKEEVSNKDKVYGIGDVVSIKDNDEKELYSLKINSVKNADDFEYKEDFEEGNQIIEVSYTYNNIDSEGDIYIHSQDLTVSDEKGAIASYSSMFPKGKPVNAPTGTTNTVEAYYGLKNSSKKVKINFGSEKYPKNKFVFEIEIK